MKGIINWFKNLFKRESEIDKLLKEKSPDEIKSSKKNKEYAKSYINSKVNCSNWQ